MNRRFACLFLGFALATLNPGSASPQISLPPAGIIDTISGNHLPGFSGDGGPALKASFGWLSGIAVDRDGNVFVIDGNRIREIASSTGIVNTIATIKGASRIAVDVSGSIFVSCQTTIQKITMPAGTVTTIAGIDDHAGYSGDGGPALQAKINAPSKVAIGALGDIYFADTVNHRIRKIAPDGRISTVAGTGVQGFSGDGGPASAAEFNAPGDVVIDPGGDLFVADSGNYRIRKVANSSGVISTIAGTGESGSSGDGGSALSAQFGQLNGLAVDAQGNLYLADYTNNRVRQIATATHTISNVAGNGIAGLRGDKGPAVNAELQTIYGIAIDRYGYLYILTSGVGTTRAVGPGAAQAPTSYAVALSSSDPKPRMGEFVTLTARVTSNLGLPALSGTVTWYKGSVQIGKTQVDGTGTASIVAELPDAGNVTITGSYSGDLSGYATLVLPVFGYALSASTNGPVAATAGHSAQFTVELNGYQGFSGEIDLSCVGLPGPGSCSLSTSSVNLSQTAASQEVTLTIQTQNPALTKADSMSGLLLAAICPVLLLLTRRRRIQRFLLALLLAIVSFGPAIALSGCGGSATRATTNTLNPANNNSNALAAGTYTFTLNAASGNELVKLPVTLVVQ
jgi:Big-like domain-containing protein/NHL repeat-containing protein